MKRVLIIDTGLYFEQGHNFSLVNKLYEIYTSKDFDVEILALESSSDYLKEYYLKKKLSIFRFLLTIVTHRNLMKIKKHLLKL